MKKIKWMRICIGICMTMIVLTLAGCADNTTHDTNENMRQKEILDQENEDGDEKKEGVQDESVEAGTETETKTGAKTETEPASKVETEPKAESEISTDAYGPVKVSQIDYDSFQSRMTDKEWEGFQQYFPVLKENAAFEVTDYYDGGVRLNKNGEVVEEEEHALFCRWDSKGVIDISHYVSEPYGEDSNEEMMLNEVKVFDLDGDGIQELILEWGSGGDILVLHYENDKFYGWKSVYRGFLMLQTNGIYGGSGGADCNSWHRLRFDHGSWIEEELASADRGEYSINGEMVEEDIFRQQIDAYETEDVTGYVPKRCVDEARND